MTSQPDSSMDVFVSRPGMNLVIAGADAPHEVREERAPEQLHRIGRARKLPSGDIEVELFALPVSGKLLIRQAHEAAR